MFTRYLGPGICRRLLAAAFFALPLLVPAMAAAQQTPAERAAQLNDEGKRLWLEENDLPAAVEKFSQATMLSPEGRYYFNLCYSLHQLGRYREALTACEAVEPNGGDGKLLEKTKVVIEDLRKRLPAPDTDQGGDPGTGTDPDTGTYPDPDTGTYPDPNTGTGGPDEHGSAPGNGPPPGPIPGLQEQAAPSDDYNWSVGAAVGFLGSTLGDGSLYGRGGAFVKLHADFMWISRLQLGVQGYLSFAQIGAEAMANSLDIAEIGGAVYKHIRLRRVYLTPLVGVQFAGLQPGSFVDQPVVKAGLRTELALSWLLGSSKTHAISVTPSVTFHSGTEGSDAASFLLQDGGTTVGLTVGYTLRFKTPFGRMALITLE